ncbi:T9SS type A sorting domain-containing protein [uncultured Pontibacter sp.]|uniref:T9SS type A sorting domain-containing protein n=1 Tax=uncultured Pontibacter sp. TaxID=453356 RepID=UPI00261B546B|nr:T9SS type A sorting domain-containing protein [uncultured Pontibacter sp.]
MLLTYYFKLIYAVCLLLVSCLFLSSESLAQSPRAVTEVISDYDGFWKSGNGAVGSIPVNPVKPSNSHNLLGFVYAGKRYSTGVDDNKLTSEGLTFEAGLYRSLPQFNITGAINSNTKVGIGQMYDGVSNGKSSASPDRNINKYLQDGINGLDLGTGVANLPKGYAEFMTTNILASAINDGVPDIIVTQIADPSGSTDTYELLDENGNRVGNLLAIAFTNITPVGKWVADFYEASVNPMTLTPGFTNTERDLRLWACDFGDLGITAEDVKRIRSFKINLSGNSDIAFVAYNANAFLNQSPILPMPVTLTSLKAQQEQDVIKVLWETASEENSSHFEVEVSQDGESFIKVGEVAAAGYSNVKQKYSFGYVPEASGDYYVRLKQVDTDGRFEYSKVVAASIYKRGLDLMVYPNPSEGGNVYLKHTVATGSEQIALWHTNGIKVKELKPEKGSITTSISTHKLAAGLYQVTWHSETEVVTTKLLVR